ncbi:MAG: potassium channel protein, partial [Thermoproteota archaeon]
MEGEERVEFKPIPARDLLVEILSTSELMIDLAYASALFNDEDLAQNVVELSEKVDRLCHQLAMIIAIAARDKEDAEAMLGLWVLASNSDKMSDAATDVAYTVLRGLGTPRIASEAFEEVEERIGRYNLNENSILVGKTPKELALEGKIGVDIIALRRGEEWIFNPSDVVLA